MQIEIFSKVKDPRVLGKVKHELEDVLRIALIGVLCSCEDYDESVFSAAAPLSVYATEEKGHGRVEKRKCSILDAKLIEKEGMYEDWPGLKHIIKVDRERLCDGSKSRETIYCLSSETNAEASCYAGRIRAHWGIENKLHRHPDVTFKEDDCRVRTGNGAENLSTIRKFAMELLKKQKDKLSLKRRRKKCLLNLDYLAMVMNES